MLVFIDGETEDVPETWTEGDYIGFGVEMVGFGDFGDEGTDDHIDSIW